MNQIVSANLWDSVEAIAKKSKTKLAAIAYVSDDSKVLFGGGDLLIVDASDSAIESAQTSARVLKDALKRGAELYSCTNLHAKLLVLGQTVVIGSANMSRRSDQALVEAALITDHPGSLAMARAFISQLVDQSVEIDGAFIQRIAKLAVVRPPITPGGSKTGRVSVTVPESRTWLLGIHDIDPARYQDEEELAEQGTREAEEHLSTPENEVGWIRFTGGSRFRREAKRGDQAIRIWREHVKDKPQLVYRHTPIIHRFDEDHWTRFYIESSDDEEEQALPWQDFLRLVEKVDMPGHIGTWTTREIDESYSEALFSLWGSMKPRRAKPAASSRAESVESKRKPTVRKKR